jgi:restriction system protein
VARSDFERALAEHERAENARLRQLTDARRSYERKVQDIQTEVREHNTAADELEADFRPGKPGAVEEFLRSATCVIGLPERFQPRVSHRLPSGTP